MDVSTINALVTGGLVLVGTLAGAGLTQGVQLARTHSDHQHDLRRDHAQRVFQYKQDKLARNRDACHAMLLALHQSDVAYHNKVVTEQELAQVRADLDRLSADLDELERAHDEHAVPQSDLDARRAALRSAMQGASEACDALSDSVMAFRQQVVDATAMMRESAEVLMVDYQAFDLVGAWAAYADLATVDPTTDAARKAYAACKLAIGAALRCAEQDLLQPPK